MAETSSDNRPFRPVVRVIAFDEDGKILACVNKDTGRHWLPGGGIDKDESLKDAAERELKEETGWYSKSITMCGTPETFDYVPNPNASDKFAERQKKFRGEKVYHVMVAVGEKGNRACEPGEEKNIYKFIPVADIRGEPKEEDDTLASKQKYRLRAIELAEKRREKDKTGEHRIGIPQGDIMLFTKPDPVEGTIEDYAQLSDKLSKAAQSLKDGGKAYHRAGVRHRWSGSSGEITQAKGDGEYGKWLYSSPNVPGAFYIKDEDFGHLVFREQDKEDVIRMLAMKDNNYGRDTEKSAFDVKRGLTRMAIRKGTYDETTASDQEKAWAKEYADEDAARSNDDRYEDEHGKSAADKQPVYLSPASVYRKEYGSDAAYTQNLEAARAFRKANPSTEFLQSLDEKDLNRRLPIYTGLESTEPLTLHPDQSLGVASAMAVGYGNTDPGQTLYVGKSVADRMSMLSSLGHEMTHALRSGYPSPTHPLYGYETKGYDMTRPGVTRDPGYWSIPTEAEARMHQLRVWGSKNNYPVNNVGDAEKLFDDFTSGKAKPYTVGISTDGTTNVPHANDHPVTKGLTVDEGGLGGLEGLRGSKASMPASEFEKLRKAWTTTMPGVVQAAPTPPSVPQPTGVAPTVKVASSEDETLESILPPALPPLTNAVHLDSEDVSADGSGTGLQDYVLDRARAMGYGPKPTVITSATPVPTPVRTPAPVSSPDFNTPQHDYGMSNNYGSTSTSRSSGYAPSSYDSEPRYHSGATQSQIFNRLLLTGALGAGALGLTAYAVHRARKKHEEEEREYQHFVAKYAAADSFSTRYARMKYRRGEVEDLHRPGWSRNYHTSMPAQEFVDGRKATNEMKRSKGQVQADAVATSVEKAAACLAFGKIRIVP